MKVYKVDQVWYDKANKRLIGDMASTFCDSDESRTPNLGELLEETKSVLEDMYNEDKADTDDTRVLEIEVADIKPMDIDDLECEYWRDNQPADGWTTIQAIAVCPKAEADEIGLTEIMGNYYKEYSFMD